MAFSPAASISDWYRRRTARAIRSPRLMSESRILIGDSRQVAGPAVDFTRTSGRQRTPNEEEHGEDIDEGSSLHYRCRPAASDIYHLYHGYLYHGMVDHYRNGGTRALMVTRNEHWRGCGKLSGSRWPCCCFASQRRFHATTTFSEPTWRIYSRPKRRRAPSPRIMSGCHSKQLVRQRPARPARRTLNG